MRRLAALALLIPALGHAQATLRGTVRADDQHPIAGADVWLTSLDHHATTDSLGKYLLADIPAGAQIVQVRHIGFAVRRDTVTFANGAEIVRDYALAAQATQLDTVRTYAGKQRYISSQLQGFEDRRTAHSSGRFISDSLLRKNESRSLIDIITSNAPGLMRNGSALVSQRRDCGGTAFHVLASEKSTCGVNGGAPPMRCYVAIYVDGNLQFNFRMANESGATPPDISHWSATQFAGIEYYPSDATAPVGMHADDSGCGSLWFWTREK